MDWMNVVIGFVLMGGALIGWYQLMRHLKGEGGSGMKLDLPKGKARREERANDLEQFVATYREGGTPMPDQAIPAMAAAPPGPAPVQAPVPSPAPARPAPSASLPADLSASPTAAPPAAAAAPLLSGPAKLAFLVFRTALPDHLVLARIPLGEIVADAGIARGHVFTLVVCRPDLAIVALADLATPGGPPPAVTATLARAGLRHVVIDPARLPRRDAVRALLALD
jgi:hypothetical protein